MKFYFFGLIKTVMEINSLAGYFFGITDFVFFCVVDRTLSRPFLPKYGLLFCTCRHAWTPGVKRRPQRRLIRVPRSLLQAHRAGARSRRPCGLGRGKCVRRRGRRAHARRAA